MKRREKQDDRIVVYKISCVGTNDDNIQWMWHCIALYHRMCRQGSMYSNSLGCVLCVFQKSTYLNKCRMRTQCVYIARNLQQMSTTNEQNMIEVKIQRNFTMILHLIQRIHTFANRNIEKIK